MNKKLSVLLMSDHFYRSIRCREYSPEIQFVRCAHNITRVGGGEQPGKGCAGTKHGDLSEWVPWKTQRQASVTIYTFFTVLSFVCIVYSLEILMVSVYINHSLVTRKQVEIISKLSLWILLSCDEDRLIVRDKRKPRFCSPPESKFRFLWIFHWVSGG